MWDTLRKVKRRVVGGKPRRRRLRLGQSVEQFISQLNQAKINYSILRWFDDLPNLDPDEDIDILIADSDVAKLDKILVRSAAKTVLCDVYSVSGLKGSDHRGLSCLPPAKANELLARAVSHRSGAMVPCEEDAFWSLAYHALYHKGYASGIPVRESAGTMEASPEHDYVESLSKLAGKLGIDVPITLHDLDNLLAHNGWRPPADTLAKMGLKNPWCAKLAEVEFGRYPAPNGIAVFFLRKAASSVDSVGQAIQKLSDFGFTVLWDEELVGHAQEKCREKVRGGNWGRGLWKRSGGGPAHVIVAVDVFPILPSEKSRREHPSMDNERVFSVKYMLRDHWNKGRKRDLQCNSVHSSDNAQQAMHYLDIAIPDKYDELHQRAKALGGCYKIGAEHLSDLSHKARRARVEKIRWGDGGAVRKTFRPGCERFLLREVEALRALALVSPEEVPVLLAHDETSFTIAHYESCGMLDIPIEERMAIADIAFAAARRFYEANYVLLDFNPKNILVLGKGRIKIIDFEFAFKCSPSRPFEESVTVVGPTSDWHDDLPLNRPTDGKHFDRTWKRALGVSKWGYFCGNHWTQKIQQKVYFAIRAARS